jgi:hypothetical protein
VRGALIVRISRGYVVAASFVVTASLGCENREPISLVEGCLAPTVEKARSDDETSEVTCELGRETILAALPVGTVDKAELLRLGLAADAAEMVANSPRSRPSWCELSTNSESDPESWKGRMQCTPTSVKITKAFVVRATAVLVTIQTVNREAVLKELKPIGSGLPGGAR